MPGGPFGGCHREEPQPVAGHFCGPGEQVRALGVVEGTALQDVLHGAFDGEGDGAERAGPPDDGGGEAAYGVEGQGGDAVVRLGEGRVVRESLRDDRLVERVRGRQVGELERPPGGDGRPVQGVGVGASGVDGRTVLGEGACLVDAEDVDGADVVQRGEPSDDDAVGAGEQRGAAGERRRDDDRQHLRGEPDGHRDGERQGLQAPAAQRGGRPSGPAAASAA